MVDEQDAEVTLRLGEKEQQPASVYWHILSVSLRPGRRAVIRKGHMRKVALVSTFSGPQPRGQASM